MIDQSARLHIVATLVLAAVVLAFSAASAHAAVTVGSDLTRAPDGWVSCEDGSTVCDGIQTALPGNAHALAVPFQGMVKTWRTKAFAAGDSPNLAAYRPDGAGGYVLMWLDTGARTRAGVTENRVGTRGKPVLAGDVLALRLSGTDEVPLAGTFPGASSTWLETAANLQLLPVPDVEFFFNADVTPDADGDGYGDEGDDDCPSDPERHSGRCRTDLAIGTTLAPAELRLAGTTVNTVTVTNVGPSASEARVSWNVAKASASMALGRVDGPCKPSINGQPKAICSLQLAPGQSAVLSAELKMPASYLRVDRPETRTFKVQASVDTGTGTNDSNRTNDSASTMLSLRLPDTAPAFGASAPRSIMPARLRSRGLPVTIRARERLSGVAKLFVRHGGRYVRIGTKRWRANRTSTVNVRIRVNRRGKRLLRLRERRGSASTLSVHIDGTDGAENEGTRTLPGIRVRRR